MQNQQFVPPQGPIQGAIPFEFTPVGRAGGNNDPTSGGNKKRMKVQWGTGSSGTQSCSNFLIQVFNCCVTLSALALACLLLLAYGGSRILHLLQKTTG